jgi:hypothetical protein
MSQRRPLPVQLQLVPASEGFVWFKQGISTFVKQPLALGGIFFIALACFQVFGLLPVVGLLAWVVLTPCVNIGLTAAMADAHHQKFPSPKRLLYAFSKDRASTRAVLGLGGIYLLGLFCLVALTWWLFGSDIAALAKEGQAAAKGAGVSMLGSPASTGTGADLPIVAGAASGASGANAAALSPTELFEALPGFFWFFAILAVPMTMMTWHAPALVFWYQVSPVKAMFFSLVAMARNWQALCIYFLAWAVTSAPIMVANAYLQTQEEVSLVAIALLSPLALALGAAFTLSSYFTFIGSFVQQVELP